MAGVLISAILLPAPWPVIADPATLLGFGSAGRSRDWLPHAARTGPAVLRIEPKTGDSLLRREFSHDSRAKAAVNAYRYFAGLLVGALSDKLKAELLSLYFYPGDERDFWNENSLGPKIAAIAAGSFKSKEPPKIKGERIRC